jgi:chromodomain-helicase-DNA-binding protein 7
MLRRRKGDVEKGIAPLEEIIVECPMTSHQRGYYRSIFSKNKDYLTRGAHAQGNSTNLQNIFMELRKVCNHPYLIKGAEDQILVERKEVPGVDSSSPDFVNESLIRSAGKMILLDKLLLKLKRDGHRVLIFSQMTRMLDILQDYFNYKNFDFERIDGAVRGDDRQAAIDRYNNSQTFVFLLCTKAGGLGINLASADTVIIYDSDWNRQNDVQATARCHRIGQTKDVKMYRLITAKSYERKMFDRASIKLALDHAVLERTSRADEMEKLLRLGAYYACENDKETERFGEEDIELVLSKSARIKHESDEPTFSVTQFELDDDDVDLAAPDFWQKYLPEVVEDAVDDRRIGRSKSTSTPPTTTSNGRRKRLESAKRCFSVSVGAAGDLFTSILNCIARLSTSNRSVLSFCIGC